MTIWRMPTRKPCGCVLLCISSALHQLSIFGARTKAPGLVTAVALLRRSPRERNAEKTQTCYRVQAPCQRRKRRAEGVAHGVRSIECLRAATAGARFAASH